MSLVDGFGVVFVSLRMMLADTNVLAPWPRSVPVRSGWPPSVVTGILRHRVGEFIDNIAMLYPFICFSWSNSFNRRPVKVSYMRPLFNVPMVEWSG